MFEGDELSTRSNTKRTPQQTFNNNTTPVLGECHGDLVGSVPLSIVGYCMDLGVSFHMQMHAPCSDTAHAGSL